MNQQNQNQFHLKTPDELFSELNSGSTGLNSQEAAKRLSEFGPNVLAEPRKKNIFERIWDQVNDPMILVLLGAALVAFLLKEVADGFIILIVVGLNTVIGLIQEAKAEKAVDALKKMSAAYAKVLRNNQVEQVESSGLVPGDIVILEAGDLVPSDMRLLESSSLKIEEASLTGESVPVEKTANAQVKADAPLGDRLNMAYSGTSVTYGRGSGLVVATGMNTEMGKIATLINETESEQTPLQQKLGEIGKFLTIGVLIICVVIFATIILKAGSFESHVLLEAFLISISLAVAAIPEGLPAVVTIVMAVGVTVMAKRRAIIKKLPAVETLGCAQVICSDKTGTLTQNKMDVRELYYDGKGYLAQEFLSDVEKPLPYYVLFLCNDSQVNGEKEIGDPTETSLKRFALKKFGIDYFGGFSRLKDLPFDSERKMMTTVNQTPEGTLSLTKGAPDEVLKKSAYILKDGEIKPISQEMKDEIMEANRAMAAKSLRVLGLGFADYSDEKPLETDLVFVGLVGMIDPPRPEAGPAIEKCKKAGIGTVMITGDHLDTAVAIAKELGILEDESQAVFGSVMDSMDDNELDKFVPGIRVFARVSPQHKVRIVQSYKRLGKVVAMTGDGVNDAPALKIADIGVGMGITGTDVSKSVSDLLLADDNFASIVNAVEEGRKIYTNIRKAVQFLLSCNTSEVISLFVATLILPPGVTFLSAVHILWINLVTDALPAIGLGMNKSDEGVMNDKPRDSKAGIFSGGVGLNIVIQGMMLSAITLIAYWFGQKHSAATGTTMAFATLATVQLFHSFNVKAGARTVFSRQTFDNPVLLLGFAVPLLLLIAIINIPVLAGLFSVIPLSLTEWLTVFGLCALIIPIDELYRLIKATSLNHKKR